MEDGIDTISSPSFSYSHRVRQQGKDG
jgi:hypothetical protein